MKRNKAVVYTGIGCYVLLCVLAALVPLALMVAGTVWLIAHI